MEKAKVKKYIFIPLFIVIVLSLYFGYTQYKDPKTKISTANKTESNSVVSGLEYTKVNPNKEPMDDGYSLGVSKLNDPQKSQYNGQILLNNLQDTIAIRLTNREKDNDFLIKVLLDYKEVAFKIGDNTSYKTEHIVKIDSMNKVNIPINLDKKLKNDKKSHKLTVSIFVAPNKYAKVENGVTNGYGMGLDYEIVLDQSNRKTILDGEFQKPLKFENVQYQGVVINNDFKGDPHGIKQPPKSINVKRGQRVKLAYRAGKYESITKHAIVLFLDWKQLEVNKNEPYILVNTDSKRLGYGTFEFDAPIKKGMYELTGYLVPNPDEGMNPDMFYPLEYIYRFTLNVQ